MNKQAEELRQQHKTWPWNFLDEVLGRRESSPLKEILDMQEIIGSVEYVLAVSKLKDREVDIIRMHFQQGKTYREIAEHYSLSGVRPGQILHHAMQQIRARPHNKAILSIGVAAYTRCRQNIVENEMINRQVEAKLFEARLEDARLWAKQHEVNPLRGKEQKPLFKFESTRIEELSLSVRAYNSMRRAGIKTVADIISYEKKTGLRRIRNFGEKSYQEIVDLLAANDINLVQEDQPVEQSA